MLIRCSSLLCVTDAVALSSVINIHITNIIKLKEYVKIYIIFEKELLFKGF